MIAEESTSTIIGPPSTSDRSWIIDPIDGSRGFAKKNGEFSIMIAFLEANQVIVGVVLEPVRQRLTYSVKGHGCWALDGNAHEPTRCRVSQSSTLGSAVLTQSHSRGPSVSVRKLSPARVVEVYSAGLKMALVARGEADLYVNTYSEFHDWDIAAGHILVEEAGGKVTGLAGEEIIYGTPGAWQRNSMIASNGVLHALAIEKMG